MKAGTLGMLATLATAHAVRAQPAPAEKPDVVAAAIQHTFQPATRPRGIAQLERLWKRAPDRVAARRALARALSWEGRLDDALAHYDALLRGSDDPELALERLQVLAWRGRTEEAEAGYLALTAKHPRLAAAQAGAARMLRWRGRPLAAISAARRAVEIAPTDAAGREELAHAYVALGLAHAARQTVEGAPAPSTELATAIRRTCRPEVASSLTASSDSFGVDRISPRARVAVPLPEDVRLELGGGASRLTQAGEVLEYGSAGAALSIAWPHLELAVSGAVHGGQDLMLGEVGGGITIRATDRVRLTLGARRRPFLEPADPLDNSESAFFASGAGGATSLLGVARRGVDELRAGMNALSDRGLYVYADGRVRRLSDGNAGYTVAAGGGLDLVALARGPRAVSLVARVDSFAIGFRDASADYFSPAQFDGHVVGGQLLVRVGPVVVSGQGGATLTFDPAFQAGWTAGGALELALGRFAIRARAERRDDVAYAVRRAWLSITALL